MRKYETFASWSPTFGALLAAKNPYDPFDRRSKVGKCSGYRFTVVMADGSEDEFEADYSEMRESAVLFYKNGGVFRMIGTNHLVRMDSVPIDGEGSDEIDRSRRGMEEQSRSAMAELGLDKSDAERDAERQRDANLHARDSELMEKTTREYMEEQGDAAFASRRKGDILEAISELQRIEWELERFRTEWASGRSAIIYWNNFPSRVRKVWQTLQDGKGDHGTFVLASKKE